MSANRAQDTGTGTTGNITLTQSYIVGYKQLNDAVGQGPRFTYWLDNELGLWETGLGYLLDATTLVREIITDNSNGNTTAISFTGTIKVYINVSAVPDYASATLATLNSNFNGAMHSATVAGSSGGGTINDTQTRGFPFVNNQGNKKFSAWQINVQSAASAGTSMRVGIFLQGADGRPTGLPFIESGNIPTDSTGIITLDFSFNTVGTTVAASLPALFFMGWSVEESCVLMGINSGDFLPSNTHNTNGRNVVLWGTTPITKPPVAGTGELPNSSTFRSNSTSGNIPLIGLLHD
jgi:hypothetical protein